MRWLDSTVLITGASSGIGEAFARRLAADGANLILVARRENALTSLAGDLRAEHGVQVTVLPMDLAKPGSVDTLVTRVENAGLTVDGLINNAGFVDAYAPFAVNDAARAREMIAVNVTSLVDLTRAFLPNMLERRRGCVINVGSTASFQPVPFWAVYGAAKAFVLSFTEAVRAENHGSGVEIFALCPGATATEFFDEVGRDAAVGAMQTPDQVVSIALRAMARGKSSVVCGRRNATLAALTRLVPRATLARGLARSTNPDNRATS